MQDDVNHFISPRIHIRIYKATTFMWYKKVNKKKKKKNIQKEGKIARGKRLRRFSPQPIKRRFPFLPFIFYYFDTYTTNLPSVFPLAFIVSAGYLYNIPVDLSQPQPLPMPSEWVPNSTGRPVVI